MGNYHSLAPLHRGWCRHSWTAHGLLPIIRNSEIAHKFSRWVATTRV